MNEDGGNYTKLRYRLLTTIESLEYKPNTIRIYERILDKIAAYMSEVGITSYTPDVGEQYISGCAKKAIAYTSPVLPAETVIRRLDDLLSGTIRIHRRAIEAQKCPLAFTEQLDRYLIHMQLRGNRASTINNRKGYCVQFLCYLDKVGIMTLPDICPQHIFGAFSVSKSKGEFRQAVVPFLKYLYSVGVHGSDLSECVPSVRKPQPMPSVYSEDEIIKLLSCIDQSALSGKRDYAIVVIASHLGFRASDICALTMDDIDFKAKSIHLTMQKTGTTMQAELLPDVETALLEYMELARPTSVSKKIFLRSRAPYSPLRPGAVYEIVRHHLYAAGIDTSNRKRGPHSLRMSLATKLLSGDVPYAAIQKILGHESPESTRHYAKMDTDMLRRCALEVPPPTGLFAKRLGIF